MKNKMLSVTCKTFLNSISAFKQSMEFSAMQTEGRIDRYEAKVINDITKDLLRLEKTINKHIID